MAYPLCKIKNISGSSEILNGKEFENNEIFIIPDLDRIDWATDDDVVAAIVAETFQVGDASEWIESHAMQIAHLQNY